MAINVTLGDGSDVTLGDDEGINVSFEKIDFVGHAGKHIEGGTDEVDVEKLNIDGNFDLETFDLLSGGNVTIWDNSNDFIPQGRLENDTVTVNANDGLKSGGTVALGDSVGLDVEPADFAGTFLSDDGNDNLTVDLGFGLEGDGSGNIRFDEDATFNLTGSFDVPADTFDATEVDIGRGLEDDGTGAIRFDEDTPYTLTSILTASAGIESNGDIMDGATLIYDSSLSQIEQDTLENDSVTVNANDGLKNGGPVALGDSVDLNIKPEDFAGLFLSDDGSDNLAVDIGRGLEDDGTGAIQFDEDTGYTFTVAQQFSDGITVTGTVSFDADQIDATEADIADGLKDDGTGAIAVEPADIAGAFITDDGSDNLQVDIGRGLEDDGSGNIQFDEGVAYTFTADQKVVDNIRSVYGSDDDFSISYNSTSNELEVIDETNNTVKMTFDKNGDVFIPNGDLAVSQDIRDGTQTIWDSTAQEIPDSAMGSIANATLTNDSLTVVAGDGLKNGGTVSLGGETTVDVEPDDFAGLFLSDDGADNLTVDIGTGLEGDPSNNIRLNEDYAATWTTIQTFGTGLETFGDITDGSNIIWDDSVEEIPDAALGTVENTTLANDSLTFTAGDGLVGGGTVALGSSATFDIEPDDFAGTFLSDDGNDNLRVDIGRGLENDGVDNIRFDEDTAYKFSALQTFSSGLETSGDITDGATLIYDASLSQIEQDALENDSVTINANDGLKNGGSVSLGNAVDLNIEPDDFAGLFLSDDGADNLTVDVGRGLENDGTGQIQFDEDTGYTFTVAQQFDAGITVTGTVSLDADQIDATEADIGRGLEDDGTGAIQFDEDVAYTFTADQKVADDIRQLFGQDDDFSISFNSTSGELEIIEETSGDVKISFDKNGDVFVPSGDLSVTGGDIRDGVQTIWDTTANEIPDSAMGSIANATLTNDSITVNANDGLKTGGTASLGGSIDLNVEPADFAGTYLQDDGGDNLEVLIGSGLENDGTGNIRFDQDLSATWTNLQTFNGGIDLNSNIDAQSNRIRNLPEPTSSDEAARKAYVDGVAQGLNLKESCRVATVGNFDLTSTTDPNPIDGVTVVDGDRVLLKHQTDGTENGIYVANTATNPSTWTRAPDFDEDAEVTSGAFTFVEEGTDHASTSYIVTTGDPITLGVTSIQWSQFASTGEIDAGDGLSKSGQVLSVLSTDLAGQFISEDGGNDLQVNIGRGLEADGFDAIRFDEDTAYNFTADQTFGGSVIADNIESPDGTTVAIDSNNDQTDRRFTVSHDGDTEDLFHVNENGDVDVLVGDLTDGTNVIYDQSASAIPQARLTNDSVTINANDGLKSGGSVALGGSVGLDIEPADFAGSFVGDDGADNLEVLIGVGLEDDGSGNIRVDEDFDYTFTSAIDFSAGLDTQGDITDGAQPIWNASIGEIPDSALGTIDNTTLANDSVTVSAGDGLRNGGTIALGGSTTLDVDVSDFAGAGLQDDGTENIELVNDSVTVNANDGLVGGGIVALGGSIGLDIEPADFAGAGLQDDGVDNLELINDSVTVNANDGLVGGGTVALGNSIGLNVEPADFAGAGLQDDGLDNLELVNDSVTVAGNTVALGGSTAISTSNLSGNTDGLTEGTSNLFYTDERSQDSVGTILGGNFTYDDVTPAITLTDDSVTINTGTDLINGGTVSLGGSITIDHANTSGQGNVSAPAGGAIGDVNLDGNGHVTSLSTVDFDGRFVNESGDTMSGNLNMNNNNISGINQLSINDSGIGEGLTFPGFQFYEDAGNGDLVIRDDTNNVDLIRQPKAGPTQFIQGADIGSIEAPEDSLTQIINSSVTSATTSGDTVGYTLSVDNQTGIEVSATADGSGGLSDGPNIAIPNGDLTDGVNVIYDQNNSQVPRERLDDDKITATVTADTTTSNEEIIYVDTSTNAVTITLSSADAVNGNEITIVDIGGNVETNPITIATEGTETIDSLSTSLIETNFSAQAIASDGTNWYTTGAGGGGGGNLSDVTIDTDKDWQNFDIFNVRKFSAEMGLRLRDDFEIRYDQANSRTILENLNTGETIALSDTGDIDLSDRALSNVDWANSDSGAGSGLNADTLQGNGPDDLSAGITQAQKASSFTESYVSVSGFTGIFDGSIDTNYGYDISNASYNNVSFSVNSEEGDLSGMEWNDTGSKLFVVGKQFDTVFEYALTTPYDISTASYSGSSFSVSGQDGNPTGITWNDTGSRMYITGIDNSSVYQYNVSTPYDLSTATYNNVSFDINSEESVPTSMEWNDTGSKMYVAGRNSDTIHEYVLTAPYDISTASYNNVSKSVFSQDNSPHGINWNNTGSKLYMVGDGSDNIYQYDVSTPYDLSTATYNNVSFNVSAQDSIGRDVLFNDNGTKMYMAQFSGTIYEYDITPESNPTSTVSLDYPNDLVGWDILTFQETLNGGGVTIDLLDETNTVLKSDISRNIDISDISPTENFKFEINFDTTGGFPKLDFLARRYEQ